MNLLEARPRLASPEEVHLSAPTLARDTGPDARASAIAGISAMALAVVALLEGAPRVGAGASGVAVACVIQRFWPRTGQLPAIVAVLLLPWLADATPAGHAACVIAATGLASVAHPPMVAAVTATVGIALVLLGSRDPLLLVSTALGAAVIFGFSLLLARERLVVTARLATRDRLLERYTLASDGAQTGLWHWSVAEDVIHLTPRAEDLLALSGGMVHPLAAWLSAVDPGDAEALLGELRRFIETDRTRFEHRVRTGVPGRGERTLLFRASAARDPAGRAARLGGSIEDITLALRQEHELLRSAFHDGLTGLANRALLLDRLAHAIAQSQRHPGRPFAVLFLDVDHFKTVNDSLGHQVGDALLCTVAERLERCVRPSDTLARLGGDEFVVLGHDLGVGQAEALAERMLVSLQEPIAVMGQEVVVSASIGVAPGGVNYVDGLDLLRDADTAMYRAKQDGRGRVCVFTEAMHSGAVLRLELERDLHRAVDRNELEVHYQPIVDLETRQVRGFEALVRWRRNGALIGPDRFIPVAEETGQIVPMTWWILEEACSTLASWRRQGIGDDIWVHINFSGRQLSEGNAVSGILAVIERCGLPANVVHIELTETSVLKQGGAVDGTLQALRAAGLQLHLDDFGTGYASISYLHRWRFDGLKIDGSFVQRIEQPAQRSIVAAILQLAKGLDMHVIAEGVETEAQAAVLRELGCRDAQGFLYSRGVPAEEARRLLGSQN